MDFSEGPPAPELPDPPARKRPLCLWVMVVIVAGVLLWIGARMLQQTTEPVPTPSAAVEPKNARLPADVPDYVARADARVTGRTVTDDGIRVSMTTINGPLSPLAFYRKELPAQGWNMTEDETEGEITTIRARKGGRDLRVTVTALPGGAGADIVLAVEE